MIGILALQGNFSEHRDNLARYGADAVFIRKPADLKDISGLIIPGGESTVMARLANSAGLAQPLGEMLQDGLPVWGTCAGAVLLCRDGLWPLVQADIQRNAYGPQLYSQTASGRLKSSGESVAMVFIRAPRFTALDDKIEVLAEYGEEAVAIRQGNALLTTFHPEMTKDSFFAACFIAMSAAGS